MQYSLGTYVYLSTLSQVDPNFAAKAKAYSTFKPSEGINARGESIAPIANAIAQLKAIAAVQAQKEHQAIEHYMAKLKKYINDDSCPKELRDKLKLQYEQLSKHNLDFNTFQTNQFDLINAINIMQQNFKLYQKRLNEIITPEPMYKVKQRLPYDIQSRVETFLVNQSKKKQRKGKNIARDQKLKALIEKTIAAQIKGFPPELMQELISLIFVDFNFWLEEQDQSYLNLKADDLDALFKTYEESYGHAGEETHLQKVLRTSEEELLTLAQDMQNNLHSTYLSKEEYTKLNDFVKTANKQEEKKKNNININGKSYSLRQATQLVDQYNKEIDENENKRFVFTFHTRTSHGNFWEMVQTVLNSGSNVSANVGADLIIPIGTVTWGERNEQNQQRLMHLSRDLGQLISDDFNKQNTITIENFNEQVKKQQDLSKSLKSRMDNTARTLTKLDEFNESFFIAHESLKLYRSSEEIDSDFEEFHGRKMNVLSALTKLYASPILADNMVDSKLLMTYLINISDATLAANQKPLETYLSIFAGLLMFDDIKSLAEAGVKEIISNINGATVECLHLYNIDGVFLPISVILNNLINQMDAVSNELASLNNVGTATVKIEGPTPSAPETSTPDAWSNLASTVMSGTTIQIHFLAGFTNYITQLFRNI